MGSKKLFKFSKWATLYTKKSQHTHDHTQIADKQITACHIRTVHTSFLQMNAISLNDHYTHFRLRNISVNLLFQAIKISRRDKDYSGQTIISNK